MTIWKSGHRFMRGLVFLLLVLGSFTHLASSQSDSKTATPSSPQPSDAQDNRGSVLTPILSGNIPVAVIFPAPPAPPPKTPVEARPFFDHFSWQLFIALNWPAAKTGRGMPNQPDDPNVFRNAKPGEPVVWGTYKEAFELFGQGDHRPTPWDSFRSSVSPCAEAAEGAKVMVMANKGGTLIDGTNEAFSFPLIDQNRHYARTEVRFNKAQYNFVRGLDDNPKS